MFISFNKSKEVKMELNHDKSRIGSEKGQVIGIPISSAFDQFFSKSSPKALLPDPEADSQYQLMPSPNNKHYSKIRHDGVNKVITKMLKLRERMDVFAQGIREHVRLGQKLSETVKGKLRMAARIVQVGGIDKVFKQRFNIRDLDEKLLKASQCYLSTTGGPIPGLLFISNNRIAFCSERSIKVSSPTGKILKVHYKVMIPLGKIKKAIETESAKKQTQRYVQVVTEDNFEFWFMGFLNHQTSFKHLQRAVLTI